MSDDVTQEILAKALKRRDQIRAELTALESVISTCLGLIRSRGHDSLADDDQPELYRAPSARAAHSAYVSEMMDAARRVLISVKRPMKRGELLSSLEKQGYKMTGTDKNKVFGTNLWRSGRFIRLNGGYWPKDVEFPS